MEVDESDETLSISNESDLLEDENCVVLLKHCPEKIIFVIDTCFEGKYFSPEQKRTFNDSLQHGLKTFFNIKSSLSDKHQFGIFTVSTDSLSTVASLTSSINILTKKLREIKVNIRDQQSNMAISTDDIIQKIMSRSALPISGTSPTEVIRFIFVTDVNSRRFYSNSDDQFQASDFPHVFIDFMLFGKDTTNNQDGPVVEENLNYFESVRPGEFYKFSPTYEPQDICEIFAKLLPHPLQRCLQEECAHELCDHH